jgi:hypothetical protein
LQSTAVPVQTTTEYAPPARPGAQTASSQPQIPASTPQPQATPAAATIVTASTPSAIAKTETTPSQALTSAAASQPPLPDSGELPNHFGRLNATFSQRAFPAVHIPPSEPGVDLYAPPLLPDGRSVYEIEIELLDRKDWRMPGADISDWFNYGFDEFTWAEYTRRRREMEELRNNPQAMQMMMVRRSPRPDPLGGVDRRLTLYTPLCSTSSSSSRACSPSTRCSSKT